MLSPVEQDVDVELSPEIRLMTNFPIDAGTVKAKTPYCSTEWDQSCSPTMLVIPKDIALAYPENLWPLYAFSGTVTVENQTHLVFTPDDGRELEYSMEYSIIIRDLWVEDAYTSCVDIINTELQLAFTTVSLPPVLVSTTLGDDNVIACSDNIVSNFKSEVSSVTAPQGDIVSLGIVSGVDQVDGSLLTAPVNVVSVIGVDGKSIVTDPVAPLIPGEQYILNVNVEYITGDPDDNQEIVFGVREAAEISLSAVPADPLEVLPTSSLPYLDSRTYALYPDEAIKVFTPQYLGDFYLKRWISPEEPEFDGSILPELDIVRSCHNLQNFTLTAEYARIPEDTYVISQSAGGTILAYGYDDEPVTGEFTLPMKEGEELHLIAVPNSGYSFSHWTSPNLPGVDGGTLAEISIPARDAYIYASNRFDIGVVFELAVECTEFTFEVNIWKTTTDPDELIDIANANVNWTTVTSTKLSGTHTVPTTAPDTYTFNLDAFILPEMQECYYIDYFWSSDGQKQGTPYGDPAIGTNLSNGFTLNNPGTCSMSINVYVKRKKYNLTVEMSMEDDKDLPWQRDVDLLKIDNVGRKKQGPIIERNADNEIVSVKYIYEYGCGDEAIWSPTVRAGQTSFETNIWLCPDGSPSNDDLWCAPEYPDPYPKTLKILMDQDWRIHHEFKGNFRITHIMYFDPENPGNIIEKNVTGTENLFISDYAPVIDLNEDIPNLQPLSLTPCANSGELHRTYPEIRFRFSEPVDEASLAIGNLKVEDYNGALREDLRNNTFYFYNSGHNGTLLNNGDEVALDLFNGSFVYMCHMNKIRISTNDKIKSATGAKLSNPFPYGKTKRTEFPSFYGWVADSRVYAENDNCLFSSSPDVIVYGYAAAGDGEILSGSMIEQENPQLRFPSSGAFQDQDRNDIVTLCSNILLVPNLKQSTVINHGWLFIDEGSDGSNKYSNTIDGVRSVLKDVLPSDWNVALGLAREAAKYFEASCNDREMGRLQVWTTYQSRRWNTRGLYIRTTTISRAGEMDLNYQHMIGDVYD